MDLEGWKTFTDVKMVVNIGVSLQTQRPLSVCFCAVLRLLQTREHLSAAVALIWFVQYRVWHIRIRFSQMSTWLGSTKAPIFCSSPATWHQSGTVISALCAQYGIALFFAILVKLRTNEERALMVKGKAQFILTVPETFSSYEEYSFGWLGDDGRSLWTWPLP